jgi:hypothetical protein
MDTFQSAVTRESTVKSECIQRNSRMNVSQEKRKMNRELGRVKPVVEDHFTMTEPKSWYQIDADGKEKMRKQRERKSIFSWPRTECKIWKCRSPVRKILNRLLNLQWLDPLHSLIWTSVIV